MNMTYVCPMHPEGARFGMIRHMMSMPKRMLR